MICGRGLCESIPVKNKHFICLLLLIGAGSACAENMEALIERNQKAALPKFPIADTKNFHTLQQAACNGDLSAQKQLPAMLMAHVKKVYQPLVKTGGLLFSVRRPIHGYDDERNNYAVNLENFFEKTTGQVQIKKRDFTVTTTNGTVFQVRYPEYKPADASVKVMKDGQAMWIALADLTAADKRFLENIFADENFKSAGEFVISSVDSRNGEVTRRNKDRVSGMDEETGEEVGGGVCFGRIARYCPQNHS